MRLGLSLAGAKKNKECEKNFGKDFIIFRIEISGTIHAIFYKSCLDLDGHSVLNVAITLRRDGCLSACQDLEKNTGSSHTEKNAKYFNN